MKDFFISFNHKDKAWAEWIAWQLVDVGYETVFAVRGRSPSPASAVNDRTGRAAGQGAASGQSGELLWAGPAFTAHEFL